MRRHPQEHFALVERLAHEAERRMLEIAQAAVDHLAGGGRRTRPEVVHFDKKDADAAAGSVSRETCSVYAAADDCEIEVGHCLLIRFRQGRMSGFWNALKNKKPLTPRLGKKIRGDCKMALAQPYQANQSLLFASWPFSREPENKADALAPPARH
jgi:hypothetical protein